jgi:hypothetical protein
MKKQSLFRRMFFPVIIVIGTMIISMNLYNFSRFIDNRNLHTIVAGVSSLFMFLSIWLGALFGNTLSFFRGAGFWERLMVCMAAPCAWYVKVLYDFFGIYSTGEFLFLFLHHLILGVPVVAVLCMGLSDIWCRAIFKRRSGDNSFKVFAGSNTATLTTGILLTVFMLWNGGHAYYYLYMDVYTSLFL